MVVNSKQHLCREISKDHEVYNICHGTSPIVFEIVYTIANDDMEYAYRWAKSEVNFCPFCGLDSEQLKKKLDLTEALEL